MRADPYDTEAEADVQPPADPPNSYYERIGGGPVVTNVVERFYALVLEDEDLRPYFAAVDMVKIKRHQVLLLTKVLGGPDQYAGRDLAEAHRGLGITEAHYRKVVHYLVGALWNVGVTEDIVTAVGIALAQVQEQIVAMPGAAQPDHAVATDVGGAPPREQPTHEAAS